MLRSGTEKTKLVSSTPKAVWSKWWTTALVVCGILVVLPFFFSDKRVTTLYAPSGEYILAVVSNDEALAGGLSGVTTMRQNEGMLFVFERSGTQCMWMKDMLFSLDIVWLDADKKVLRTEQNVSPDTYPDQEYCANSTKYVVELNAGAVQKSGISVGAVMELDAN